MLKTHSYKHSNYSGVKKNLTYKIRVQTILFLAKYIHCVPWQCHRKKELIYHFFFISTKILILFLSNKMICASFVIQIYGVHITFKKRGQPCMCDNIFITHNALCSLCVILTFISKWNEFNDTTDSVELNQKRAVLFFFEW